MGKEETMGVKTERVPRDTDIEAVDEEIKEAAVEDDELLAELKARLASKSGEEEPASSKDGPKVSIRMGVLGSGQAGSRLAETFSKLGYPAVVINTASQDLEHIDLPSSSKLLLEHGLGGAGKELEIGAAAAETHRGAIEQLVEKNLCDAQVLVFCTSLGGGSGAGSAEVVVDLLSEMERPLVVVTVLPMSTEDPQTKNNAIITLSRFTKLVQSRKIDNLVVVDNARIEVIYSEVGLQDFFPVSNQAIVEPIHQFNLLSAQASSVKGLDPTEFGKILTDGQGLTIYGKMGVSNYEEPTAIAEAVIDNLNDSLLASGFNLKQSRYGGVIIVANEKVWSKVPNAHVDYAMSMVNEMCGNPRGLFKGIYTDNSIGNEVVVYSMFAGLGLPEDRVAQLQRDAHEKMAQSDKKDEERNLSLKIDAEEETISAAEAVKRKIKAKRSSFGKLHQRAIIDRRK